MTKKIVNRLSFGEELGNALSHGIPASLLLCFLPYVAIHSYLKGGVVLTITTSIYIISIFLMLLSSTLYHSMAYDTKHKQIFQILDHSFIFVAIAGSYTPIAIYVLPNWIGYSIVIIQWLMVIFGIIYKCFAKKKNSKLSLAIYLVMGWMAIIIIPELISKTSPIFLSLLILGGVFYSIGAWFYAQKKPYYHLIWHFFIVAASLSHLIAIIWYL